jgi:Hemerythrin HHE cation binding domain
MNPENQRQGTACTLEFLEAAAEPILSPGEVRRIILTQHAQIRVLLQAIEDKTIGLLAASVPNAAARTQTRELALRLCSVMATHIALENRILVAAIATIDAWGAVRASQLREEHAEQLLILRAYADELAVESATGAALAMTAAELVALIRADMDHEEATVLQASLLSDDGLGDDVETG